LQIGKLGAGVITRFLNCMSLLLAIATVGCAARGPSRQATAALATAEALVRQGCYLCLQEAAGILEQQVSADRASSATLTARLVEARVLEGLRQRELGIDSSQALAQARSLAVGLGAPRPGALDYAALLDLAELVPGDPTTLIVGNRTLPYPQWQARVKSLRAALDPAIPSSRLATYVALSAACEDQQMREAFARDAITNAHPDTPLLTYRLATCALEPDESVGALVESDARWHEAAWHLGRRQLATSRDVRRAADLFARAASGLPDTPTVLLSLAGAQQALRQLDAALATYDRLLAIAPAARPALLGRVICLTYLGRHTEAVGTATRMIDLGTFLLGDARYWRAWNYYQLADLAAAEADAEQALLLMSNTNAYTLAGVVKFDLKRLDDAESRLRRAWEMDSANCQAIWYLGLVHTSRADWEAGATDFATAVSCFTQAAATARAELAALDRSTDPPETRAAAAAEHQVTIKSSELRAAQSAYNAGQCLARTGNRAGALNYLAIAAEHPEMKEQAERLRASLPVPR
jgi:tetratricopeptide (TPR) repeat protein